MTESRREALLAPLRAMQIIVFGLAMGIVIFAGVAIGYIRGPAELRPEGGALTYLAAGVAAITTSLSIIVPRMTTAAARRRIAAGEWRMPSHGDALPPSLAKLGNEGKLVIVYQTALIIGAALCEGPAFFGLVAMVIEKSLVGVVIAGVCLLLLLARFPTLGRLENWLDAQRRSIEEERMLPR